MENYFTRCIKKAAPEGIAPLRISLLARLLVQIVSTEEFAALYEQRINREVDLGLGGNVNQLWRKAMSAQTEAMAAAIVELKKSNGVTPEQVQAEIHAVLDPQINDLTTKIQSIVDGEAAEDEKIADIQATIKEFTDAFAPPAQSNPESPSDSPADSVAESAPGDQGASA